MYTKRWFGPWVRGSDAEIDATPDRGHLVPPGSAEGLTFGYTVERFPPGDNWIFLDGKVAYISCIFVSATRKGYTRDLFARLFEMGFTIRVPNPLNTLIDMIWKYGFSMHLDGDVELWELDASTHALPKVRAGIVAQCDRKFVICAFSDFLDRKGRVIRIGEIQIEPSLLGEDGWREKVLEELKEKVEMVYKNAKQFREHYPNGYHLLLMPQNHRCGDMMGDYLKRKTKNPQ